MLLTSVKMSTPIYILMEMFPAFFSSQTDEDRNQLLHGQSEHLRFVYGFTQLLAKFHLHAELRLGFRCGVMYGVQLHCLLDGFVVRFHADRHHSQQVS